MAGREIRNVQSILQFPKQCDDREKTVGQFIIFFFSFSVFIGRNSFKVNNNIIVGRNDLTKHMCCTQHVACTALMIPLNENIFL